MVLLVWHNICEKIVFREKIGSSKNPLGVERIRIFPSASKKYSLIRDGDRERERGLWICHVPFSDAHKYLSIS